MSFVKVAKEQQIISGNVIKFNPICLCCRDLSLVIDSARKEINRQLRKKWASDRGFRAGQGSRDEAMTPPY
jgi:hypothetical protein